MVNSLVWGKSNRFLPGLHLSPKNPSQFDRHETLPRPPSWILNWQLSKHKSKGQKQLNNFLWHPFVLESHFNHIFSFSFHQCLNLPHNQNPTKPSSPKTTPNAQIFLNFPPTRLIFSQERPKTPQSPPRQHLFPLSTNPFTRNNCNPQSKHNEWNKTQNHPSPNPPKYRIKSSLKQNPPRINQIQLKYRTLTTFRSKFQLISQQY